MEVEKVEEFVTYFDKQMLETNLLNMESVINKDTDEKKEFVQSIFREIHSLKGTAGVLKIDVIQNFLHIFEEALGVVSKNVMQIVRVKNSEIFDFFLKALDLIEKLTQILLKKPNYMIKAHQDMFNYYIRETLSAKYIVEHQDEFLEFKPLDEDLF